MLVHAYLTDGFLEMAKVFLRSLHVAMGTSAPYVWLDTRGLTAVECDNLKTYSADGMCHIVNRAIPMKDWAARAGVSVRQLKIFKEQCEQRFVSNKNRVWKLMTAGDDRVQALYDLIWNPPKEGPDWTIMPKFFVHFDIDTLFRKPLIGLPKMMEEADIWLKLRRGHKTLKARITIDTIFLNGADNVRAFFDRWRYHINRVPPRERPVGWGQASCWHAFVETEAKLNYKQLPLEYGLPGRNWKEDVIWTGNVHKLAKDDCVKLFIQELAKWNV
jgi:hypothetical protein